MHTGISEWKKGISILMTQDCSDMTVILREVEGSVNVHRRADLVSAQLRIVFHPWENTLVRPYSRRTQIFRYAQNDKNDRTSNEKIDLRNLRHLRMKN